MVTRSQAEVDAEAATWLALLDGPERDGEMDRALRRWLETDPAHAAAFARATEAWDIVPGAVGTEAAALARPLPRARLSPWPKAAMALAASIALILAAGSGWFLIHARPAYETAIGSQQTLMLDDGTRVSLNTDSRISVRYNDHERRVRLDRGEALFEVRKNPSRPFIVEADGEEVRALGTTFVVRHESGRMAVTLLEGKVEVSRQAGAIRSKVAILSPGQRLTVRPEAGATMDRPLLDAVTAWRRGEAIFTGTPLIDAAAELNRYGRSRIIVDDPAIAQLPVSGVFATSDVDEFARAIAEVHGLHIAKIGETVRLSR